MASLIVRKLEKEVVQKLREQAAKYGISMEEQHRRILRQTLMPTKRKFSREENLRFSQYLIGPPYVDIDLMDYIPKRVKKSRRVNLE